MKLKQGYRLPEKDIKPIQNIEFDILKEFIKVCDKLSLTYYLHGGTLLGAVMYQGFIPWDDDIDVSMPRDDYEIFLKEGQKYLPEHLRIQTCYNDKEYTLCFAKIRNINTILIEYSLQNRKHMMNGVYIDIFPIDGMKDKKKSFYAKCLRRRIDMSYWDTEKFNPLKKLAIAVSIFPFLFISSNKATRLLDTYRQKIRIPDDKHPDIMLVNRWYYPTEYYIPKSNNKVIFNGAEMNSVPNPDKWLYIDYPHWKEIPPKDKQVPGHILIFYSF